MIMMEYQVGIYIKKNWTLVNNKKLTADTEDLDDDGDGIPDSLEEKDTDNDGIPGLIEKN